MASGNERSPPLRLHPSFRHIAAAAIVGALALGGPAQAQHRHPGAHPPWHGDIRRFPEHDWGVWRGGRWYHGTHHGRIGWWWIVGGAWYFYPAPVYPYPDPYAPPAAALLPSPAEVPPAARYWYYCEPAGAYYPYMPTCQDGWRQVPARPAGPPFPP
jgi:hypothetical protein